MHSLIDDPVFYKLLVNSAETHTTKPLDNELTKFEFPLITQKDSTAESVDSSYQQSIFSNDSSTSTSSISSLSPVSKPHDHFKPIIASKIAKKVQLSYHKCPFCQRQFKSKAYLTRHMKMHDSVKDFKCPFFNEAKSKCHHLHGEFSRKDTLKAHLKSIHFIYPIGISKSARNSSPGRCAGCFEEFSSNSEWMTTHIEGKGCSAFNLDSNQGKDI